MASKREQILAALQSALETVFGEGQCLRNITDFPDTKSKQGMCAILEGDEEVDEVADFRGRPNARPVIVTMKPEVFFRVQGEPASLGTKMTDARDDILKAVLESTSWVDLCHNGDVRYSGYATSFAAGRALDGTAAVSFSFRYIMRPDRLGQ